MSPGLNINSVSPADGLVDPAKGQEAASKTPFFTTAESLRLASRSGAFSSITSGQAPTHIQASPVILPSRYAKDFRLLCARNPVPCPIIAESAGPGVFNKLKSNVPTISDEALARDLDIRRDTPRYNVYREGKLVKESCTDIMAEWTDDYVTFLIGCSYSFETALTNAGLPPVHNVKGYNCPMYRTTIPLCGSGVFQGTYVVSMRTYKKSDMQRVREVTRPFVFTHGEPIAWGWEAVKEIGIVDIDRPEWGDAPQTVDGRPLSQAFDDEENVPVFWGCGTTPQDVVMKSKLPETIMCHSPGHILVLDAHDWDVMRKDA